MTNARYMFFMSRIKLIYEIKENEKIKISMVLYDGTQSSCILKEYKNRDMSAVCEVLCKIRHPNLTTVYDYVYQNGSTYVIEEFITGKSLSEYMEEKGVFSEKETIKIISDVCAGLNILHSQQPPIIHNDVKTSNIMIREDGSVKLIDFDISRTLKAKADKNTHLYGTKEYASPEHFGFGQSEPRSDIYSLGVTMHEMLSGKSLNHEHELIYKGSLSKIIKKCIQVDRKKRYSTVASLNRDLRRKVHKKKGISIFVIVVLFLFLAFICRFQSYYRDLMLPISNTHNNILDNTVDSDKQTADESTGDKYLEDEESELTDKFVETREREMRTVPLSGEFESMAMLADNTIVILEKESDKYYIKVGEETKLLDEIIGTFGCILAYDNYADSLYLFEFIQDSTRIYSIDGLSLAYQASVKRYNNNVSSDTICCFFSDGMVFCSAFEGYILNSNNWTRVTNVSSMPFTYVIKDKFYKAIYDDLKFKQFNEINFEGKLEREHQPNISFCSDFLVDKKIYSNGLSAYFIATQDEKDYLYRFDGENYRTIVCLSDYKYYTPFEYDYLVVSDTVIMCYNQQTNSICEFKY